MKRTKRILATLLALALTLTLAVPVFADKEEPEEPNPALPVIDVQPQGVNVIRRRETFTLSVQAHAPNGDELGYEWYCDDSCLTGWKEKSITTSLARSYVNDAEYYYVVVYNRCSPEYRVTSQTVKAELVPPTAAQCWQVFSKTFKESFLKIFSMLAGAPLYGVMLTTFGGPLLFVPVAVLASPLIAVLAVAGTAGGVALGLVAGVIEVLGLLSE